MSAPEGFGHILQVLIEHRSGPAGNLANWEELLEQCNGYYSWQLAPGSGLKRVQCRCAGVCFLVAASSASLPGSRLHHHTQPSVNRLPVLHASPPLHTFCRAPTLSADDPRLLSSASLCCTPPRLCFLQGGDVQRGRPLPLSPASFCFTPPCLLPAFCRAATFSVDDPRLDLAAARSADVLVAVRGPACVQWLGMREGAALLELRCAP